MDLTRIGMGFMTGGLSELLPEDTVSRVPIVGGLLGGQTDAQKALIAKQRQMAEEAKRRQQAGERDRMMALGQSMLAFAPQNQVMAQIYGPDAAFSPDQFAAMAGGTGPQLSAELQGLQAFNRNGQPGLPPGAKEKAPRLAAEMEEYLRKKRNWDEQQAFIKGNMKAPGPGPAPISTTQAAPARRY